MQSPPAAASLSEARRCWHKVCMAATQGLEEAAESSTETNHQQQEAQAVPAGLFLMIVGPIIEIITNSVVPAIVQLSNLECFPKWLFLFFKFFNLENVSVMLLLSKPGRRVTGLPLWCVYVLQTLLTEACVTDMNNSPRTHSSPAYFTVV